MSKKLNIALKTSFTLVEQFQSTLTSPPDDASNTSGNDPLPLLSAAASLLKSHVTKLALLTITAPFTPSAVCTPLAALNESVLPSLVTAALLVTPTDHTKAFQDELRVLTGTALKELSLLLTQIERVAEEEKTKKGKHTLSQSEKDTVTVAAGRVWDAVDSLVDVTSKGVVGFVIRRAEEYRDLVRDAIEEIEEWDPDDDEDEFFDELLGDDDDDDDGEGPDDDGDEDDEDEKEDNAALHAQKKSTLRVLKPIAQIYPAIIANRLKKMPALPTPVGKLESLVSALQVIPQHVDEIAGALYEEDAEKYTQHLRKAKDSASSAVDLVTLPWDIKDGDQKQAGDKFTTWSKTWLKVMEEVSKPMNDTK